MIAVGAAPAAPCCAPASAAVGVFSPAKDGLMPRAQVLVEIVCLVHLVSLYLLGVEPALEELGVVPGEDLVAFLDLAELELERVDLVV